MSRATAVSGTSGVRVSGQPHQRDGLFDVKLGDQHAGGLADLRAGQGTGFSPATVLGVGETHHQHRCALGHRIQARNLAHGELKFIDGPRSSWFRATGP